MDTSARLHRLDASHVQLMTEHELAVHDKDRQDTLRRGAEPDQRIADLVTLAALPNRHA